MPAFLEDGKTKRFVFENGRAAAAVQDAHAALPAWARGTFSHCRLWADWRTASVT